MKISSTRTVDALLKEYQKKQEANKKRARLAMMDAVKHLNGMPIGVASQRSGISTATLRKYKNGKAGPRGPFLYTFIGVKSR